MTDDDALEQFGLPPRDVDVPAIREQLLAETAREAAGDASENATLALSVMLFAAGNVEDSLVIWRAKRASYDAGFRIDVQLLCGAGLEATLRYLRGIDDEEARKAVAYVEKCVAAGDFEGDRLAQVVPFYRRYYRLWVDVLRRGAVPFGDREVALGASREEVAKLLGDTALVTTPILGFDEQAVKLTFEEGKLACIACVDPSWRKQTGGWDDYDEAIDFANFKAGVATFERQLGAPTMSTDMSATWIIGDIELAVIYELRTPSVGIYITRR